MAASWIAAALAVWIDNRRHVRSNDGIDLHQTLSNCAAPIVRIDRRQNGVEHLVYLMRTNHQLPADLARG
jgi:hypothetical protein